MRPKGRKEKGGCEWRGSDTFHKIGDFKGCFGHRIKRKCLLLRQTIVNLISIRSHFLSSSTHFFFNSSGFWIFRWILESECKNDGRIYLKKHCFWSLFYVWSWRNMISHQEQFNIFRALSNLFSSQLCKLPLTKSYLFSNFSVPLLIICPPLGCYTFCTYLDGELTYFSRNG